MYDAHTYLSTSITSEKGKMPWFLQRKETWVKVIEARKKLGGNEWYPWEMDFQRQKNQNKKKEMYIILKLSAGNKSDSPGKCDLLKITRFFFFQNCGQLYNAFLCVKIIIEK